MIKYRLWCRESERGWGSKMEYHDYDTREEAQVMYDKINDALKPGPAPDYYYQAERIEIVDDTLPSKYQ